MCHFFLEYQHGVSFRQKPCFWITNDLYGVWLSLHILVKAKRAPIDNWYARYLVLNFSCLTMWKIWMCFIIIDLLSIQVCLSNSYLICKCTSFTFQAHYLIVFLSQKISIIVYLQSIAELRLAFHHSAIYDFQRKSILAQCSCVITELITSVVVSCPTRLSSIFQHPKNREKQNSDVLLQLAHVCMLCLCSSEHIWQTIFRSTRKIVSPQTSLNIAAKFK